MSETMLHHGDCLKLMKSISDNSIDLILCDLPYGLVACEWDKVLNFKKLWHEYHRILKKNGIALLFGTNPFTSNLINSNMNDFSHIWYWKKNYATGFFNAKKQPMKCIEEVVVFICNKPNQNNEGLHENLRKYFFDELKKTNMKRSDIDKLLNNKMSSHYFTNGQQFTIPSEKDYKKLQSTGHFKRNLQEIKKEFNGGEDTSLPTYNPQGLKTCEKYKSNKSKQGQVYGSTNSTNEMYIQKKTGYPLNLIEFDGVHTSEREHPTQKPVKLLEYLIKTYSNEGDIVLDNCMGSGSTGVACINTNRNFIGMEMDFIYYNIAVDRIENARNNAS